MEVIVGQTYQHFKGDMYKVLAEAVHTETGEKLVVYQALYDESKIYARPYDMFISKVDRVKYPDADAEYRFTPVNISEEDTAIDSRVMAFLDADDFSVKLRILQDMKDNVTNNMLYTMAFSIDFALNDGTTEEKYEELLNGLTLRARFENSRLRS